MQCRELVEVVTDYLEGALSSEDVAEVERHLESCEGCVNYLDQMRKTIRLTGRLSEDGIPPQAREALLEAFRVAMSR